MRLKGYRVMKVASALIEGVTRAKGAYICIATLRSFIYQASGCNFFLSAFFKNFLHVFLTWWWKFSEIFECKICNRCWMGDQFKSSNSEMLKCSSPHTFNQFTSWIQNRFCRYGDVNFMIQHYWVSYLPKIQHQTGSKNFTIDSPRH